MKHTISVVSLLCIVLFLSIGQSAHAFTEEMYKRSITFFFPDMPHVVDIARCESGLRQFDESGRVLRGGLDGGMIGLFQLHERYHRMEALSRGYNIDTLLGNIGYARELYREQGVTPWNSSYECWSPAVQVEESEVFAVQNVPTTLVSTLMFGTRDAEVVLLQRLLQNAGYKNELEGYTEGLFDFPTYRALLRFQCAKEIACPRDGGPALEIGSTGPRTREALEVYSTRA